MLNACNIVLQVSVCANEYSECAADYFLHCVTVFMFAHVEVYLMHLAVYDISHFHSGRE